MSTGPALLAQFTALDTATVSDALDACGLPPGQGGLRPMWGRPKVAGFAVTVELEPLSGTLSADHGGAHILTGAIAGAGPDDVIVVANAGRTDVSSWGGIVSVGAAVRSVRGVITDGACRDVLTAWASRSPRPGETTAAWPPSCSWAAFTGESGGCPVSTRATSCALQDGILEEVLVVGYLLSRLRLLGLSPASAVAIGAVLRGSYHLHQGIGPFIGNLIMGVIFGILFLRWRRTNPMIIAHALINSVAFIGYTLLAGHVSWLP